MNCKRIQILLQDQILIITNWIFIKKLEKKQQSAGDLWINEMDFKRRNSYDENIEQKRVYFS